MKRTGCSVTQLEELLCRQGIAGIKYVAGYNDGSTCAVALATYCNEENLPLGSGCCYLERALKLTTQQNSGNKCGDQVTCAFADDGAAAPRRSELARHDCPDKSMEVCDFDRLTVCNWGHLVSRVMKNWGQKSRFRTWVAISFGKRSKKSELFTKNLANSSDSKM